jgi:hypothetical protein
MLAKQLCSPFCSAVADLGNAGPVFLGFFARRSLSMFFASATADILFTLSPPFERFQ